jgi:hypothetical protein
MPVKAAQSLGHSLGLAAPGHRSIGSSAPETHAPSHQARSQREETGGPPACRESLHIMRIAYTVINVGITWISDLEDVAPHNGPRP